MSGNKQNPGLINVQITVVKNGDGFKATYVPEIIPVIDNDTILNLRIVAPTPDDVIISSVQIVPVDQDQLSTPSISRDGKQVTLSDVNTAKQNFGLSFIYGLKNGERLRMNSQDAQARLSIIPEVENNPPG